jgi:hypothetical protein
VGIVPWDFAQIRRRCVGGRPDARAAPGAGVPLGIRPTMRLPLRPLVGANMPAVLVEVGFLTSPSDEAALNGAEVSGAIVEAIVDTVSEIRRAGPPAAGDCDERRRRPQPHRLRRTAALGRGRTRERTPVDRISRPPVDRGRLLVGLVGWACGS